MAAVAPDWRMSPAAPPASAPPPRARRRSPPPGARRSSPNAPWTPGRAGQVPRKMGEHPGISPENLGKCWKNPSCHPQRLGNIEESTGSTGSKFGKNMKKHHVFKFTLPELSHCQVRDRLAPNKAIRTHIEGEGTWGHPQGPRYRKEGNTDDKWRVFITKTYKNHENQLELQLG